MFTNKRLFTIQAFTITRVTSAKIWYPIKVAEVEIAASGGRRSSQGPGEKKFDQKFWNPQFFFFSYVINLKRKLRKIIIYIWNKFSRFCYEKIEKKIDFVISDPKKS